LLVAVSVAYLGVAYGYWKRGQPGLALAFVGYVVANIGFIVDLKR
jgi:hypothetical protein